MPAVTLIQRRGARELPCSCGCGGKIKPREPLVVHVYGRKGEEAQFYRPECWNKIKKGKEKISCEEK